MSYVSLYDVALSFLKTNGEKSIEASCRRALVENGVLVQDGVPVAAFFGKQRKYLWVSADRHRASMGIGNTSPHSAILGRIHGKYLNLPNAALAFVYDQVKNKRSFGSAGSINLPTALDTYEIQEILAHVKPVYMHEPGWREYTLPDGTKKYAHIMGTSCFTVKGVPFMAALDFTGRMRLGSGNWNVQPFSFFLARLPKPVKSEEEGFELLKPAELRGKKEGVDYQRQGDMFFIPEEPDVYDEYTLESAKERGLALVNNLAATERQYNECFSSVVDPPPDYSPVWFSRLGETVYEEFVKKALPIVRTHHAFVDKIISENDHINKHIAKAFEVGPYQKHAFFHKELRHIPYGKVRDMFRSMHKTYVQSDPGIFVDEDEDIEFESGRLIMLPDGSFSISFRSDAFNQALSNMRKEELNKCAHQIFEKYHEKKLVDLRYTRDVLNVWPYKAINLKNTTLGWGESWLNHIAQEQTIQLKDGKVHKRYARGKISHENREHTVVHLGKEWHRVVQGPVAKVGLTVSMQGAID